MNIGSRSESRSLARKWLIWPMTTFKQEEENLAFGPNCDTNKWENTYTMQVPEMPKPWHMATDSRIALKEDPEKNIEEPCRQVLKAR